MKYENKTMCKACAGQCCKKLPGCYLPSDFKPYQLTKKGLTNLLRSGNYAFDWWECDILNEQSGDRIRSFFLRPSIINDSRKFSPSWGGSCSHLTDDGCQLSYENRPYECRMLEPKANDKCKPHGGGKEKSAKAWVKYEAIIKNIEEDDDIFLLIGGFLIIET